MDHRCFKSVFNLVPVCPEIRIGLGIPRLPIRLGKNKSQVRLVEPKSGRDLTEEMKAFSQGQILRLQSMNLSRYIVKRDSSTCGLEGGRVYSEFEIPSRDGTGLFTTALLDTFPFMPVEEEGLLPFGITFLPVCLHISG